MSKIMDQAAYIQRMESAVMTASKAIEKLKHENATLKNRILELETEQQVNRANNQQHASSSGIVVPR